MIVLLLLSIIPQPDGILRESVDIIELNHLHGDDDGGYQCSQLIFWTDTPKGYRVLDSRLVRKVGALPVRDWQHGGYRLEWHERHNWLEATRCVRSATFHESWTLNRDDPEKLDRKKLPEEFRRRLLPGTPFEPFTAEWK